MSVGIKKLYYCTNVEACTYARSDHPFSKVSDVRHPVCEGLHEDGCGSALKIHVEDSRGTKLSFFAISVVVLLSAFWVVKQEFFPTPLTGIEFAQLQTKIDEADATLTLTLVRVDDAEGPLRVEYQTRDGSARAGSDYLASAGVVRFSSTEASKTITINILADDEDGEVEENFVVSLNNVLHTPEHLVVIRESSAALARAQAQQKLRTKQQQLQQKTDAEQSKRALVTVKSISREAKNIADYAVSLQELALLRKQLPQHHLPTQYQTQFDTLTGNLVRARERYLDLLRDLRELPETQVTRVIDQWAASLANEGYAQQQQATQILRKHYLEYINNGTAAMDRWQRELMEVVPRLPIKSNSERSA